MSRTMFISGIVVGLMLMFAFSVSAWNSNPGYNPFEIIWNAINDILDRMTVVEEECQFTCATNWDCHPDAFCMKEDGSCDAMGNCEEKPVTCSPVPDKVCGCDGRTYQNKCFANNVGVNVDYSGECPPVECADNSACLTEEYCKKSTGDCIGTGVCTSKPAFCPDVWDPMCGCDGKTYANECYAALSGVSTDYLGECIVTCTDNGDCGVDEYCSKTEGDCDGEGECTAMPTTCPDVWSPVCGCDGSTYANSCDAAYFGVNVLHEGECVPLSCTVNGDCSAGEYCAKIVGDCDGEGECTEMPAICPDIWDPMCGCDGSTYSNSCYAAYAGVNVLHRGECVPPSCTDNGDCDVAEYCAKDTGDCSGEGQCEEMPAMCPDIWDPMCTCDFMTYANACYAAMAGKNVDHTGECSSIICYGIPASSPSVCSEHGICMATDFCDCQSGWTGADCSTPIS